MIVKAKIQLTFQVFLLRILLLTDHQMPDLLVASQFRQSSSGIWMHSEEVLEKYIIDLKIFQLNSP